MALAGSRKFAPNRMTARPKYIYPSSTTFKGSALGPVPPELCDLLFRSHGVEIPGKGMPKTEISQNLAYSPPWKLIIDHADRSVSGDGIRGNCPSKMAPYDDNRSFASNHKNT